MAIAISQPHEQLGDPYRRIGRLRRSVVFRHKYDHTNSRFGYTDRDRLPHFPEFRSSGVLFILSQKIWSFGPGQR